MTVYLETHEDNRDYTDLNEMMEILFTQASNDGIYEDYFWVPYITPILWLIMSNLPKISSLI